MISSRESLKAWLRLSLTPGVGNVTARALLLKFGLPEAIFEQSACELQAIVSSALGRQLRLIPLGLEEAVDTTWNGFKRRRISERPRSRTSAFSAWPMSTIPAASCSHPTHLVCCMP